MDELKRITDGLDEISGYSCEQMSLFDNDVFIRGIANDAIELINTQQAKIKYLQSEKERLSSQNKSLKKKKGHWEMKFRHHKSVRHVKGYDAYDVEREIELVEESEGYEPYCSECGAAAAESFLCFCPKCGADMRESIKKEGEQE